MVRPPLTLLSIKEEQFRISGGLVKDHHSTSSLAVAECTMLLPMKTLEMGVCGPDNSPLKISCRENPSISYSQC